MRECSKAARRRAHDPDFVTAFLVGDGIDIGGRPDPLDRHRALFPRMGAVRIWDIEDGDAETLTGVGEASFDFVHSSHCLEHLADCRRGLATWFRALKPGGHLIVTVPDEDLYEQGVFPSTFNPDHKWTFTVCKERSWSPVSCNVVDLVEGLGPEAELRRLSELGAGYDRALPRFDQTLTAEAECAIEFVVRKRADPDEASSSTAPAARLPATGRATLTVDEAVREARRLLKAGEIEAAGRLAEMAITVRPQHGAAQHVAGLVALKRRDRKRAIDHFERAGRGHPPADEALLDLGRLLLRMKLYPAALAPLRRAASIPLLAEAARPLLAGVLYRLSIVEGTLGARPETRLAHAREILAIDPGSNDGGWLLAEALLRAGDLKAGFEAYERRALWRDNALRNRAPRLPVWQGEDLDGRHLLVFQEQGLGDGLQFCRYVPLLVRRGIRPSLLVSRSLMPLLGCLEGVEAIGERAADFPTAELAVSMMSLPWLLGTTLETIPATVPYLTAPAERVAHWGRRLAGLTGLRIAFAWRGNRKHMLDRHRSLAIERLRPWFERPETTWIGLVIDEEAAGEIGSLDRANLVDLSGEIEDFADTAAVLAHVDLVVTVDSALAHLAGALAVPAVVLLGMPSDWRWLTDRDDSPWYPTLRLVRRQAGDDWSAVIARAGEAVDAALADWRSR